MPQSIPSADRLIHRTIQLAGPKLRDLLLHGGVSTATQSSIHHVAVSRCPLLNRLAFVDREYVDPIEGQRALDRMLLTWQTPPDVRCVDEALTKDICLLRELQVLDVSDARRHMMGVLPNIPESCVRLSLVLQHVESMPMLAYQLPLIPPRPWVTRLCMYFSLDNNEEIFFCTEDKKSLQRLLRIASRDGLPGVVEVRIGGQEMTEKSLLQIPNRLFLDQGFGEAEDMVPLLSCGELRHETVDITDVIMTS